VYGAECCYARLAYYLAMAGKTDAEKQPCALFS